MCVFVLCVGVFTAQIQNGSVFLWPDIGLRSQPKKNEVNVFGSSVQNMSVQRSTRMPLIYIFQQNVNLLFIISFARFLTLVGFLF